MRSLAVKTVESQCASLCTCRFWPILLNFTLFLSHFPHYLLIDNNWVPFQQFLFLSLGIPLANRTQHAWKHAGFLGSVNHEKALQAFFTVNKLCRTQEVVYCSDYKASLMAQMKFKPELFHSYIRWKKKGSPLVGEIKLPSGELIANPGGMCEVFTSKFVSVYSN